MKLLTEKQVEDGYLLWRFTRRHRRADDRLAPFLAKDIAAFGAAGWSGWLKDARKALGLTGEDVATKMGVSRAAYFQFEKSEEKGAITLNSLARLAEAMDCELVYAFRPKEKTSFSVRVWRRIFPQLARSPGLQSCDPKKRPLRLAALARDLMD